jgi:hypothetical protein
MIDREVTTAILRALHAAKEAPMPDDALKNYLRNLFSHVTFTSSELTDYIKDCDDKFLIAGTNDEVFGLMWALTPKGKIRAQQLR